MSDIATGNGLKVVRNFWLGDRQRGRSRKIIWSVQGKSNEIDWSTWKRFLRIVVCKEWHGQLETTLGSWYEIEAANTLPNLSWFWEDNTKDLYNKNDQNWRKYRKVNARA